MNDSSPTNKPSPSHEKRETLKLVLQIVSTASIVLAAISVAVSYLSFRGQHDWNRRLYTMELLRNYDRDAKFHSDEMNKYFPDALRKSEETKLSGTQAKDLYTQPKCGSASAGKPDPNAEVIPETSTFAAPGESLSYEQATRRLSCVDRIKRREHVVAYMNYMEFICIAYESNMVDREIIYEGFGSLFIRRFNHLEEFITAAQNEQKSTDSWSPIVRVVGEWRSRNNQKVRERGNTGQKTRDGIREKTDGVFGFSVG